MSRNQLQLGVLALASPRVTEAQEGVAAARDEDAWDRLHSVIERIAVARQKKQVAMDLDVAPSQFSEALGNRDKNGGKQLQLRWLPTFVRLCPLELRAEFREALLAMFDDEPLTPEEELEQLRAIVLADLGPAGARAVEQARRRRRKVR